MKASFRIFKLSLIVILLYFTSTIFAQGTTCGTATVITADGTFNGNVEETTEAYYTFTFGVAANVTVTLKDLNNSSLALFNIFEDDVACDLSNNILPGGDIVPDGNGDLVYTFDVLPSKYYTIKIFDGYYLSFGVGNGLQAYEFEVTFNAAPGGVYGANLWLKANDGATNSGSNLTGWTDQTGTNSFTVNGTPGYLSSGLNFYPAVSFDNAEAADVSPGDYLAGNTSITVKEAFAVYTTTNAESGALIGSSLAFSGGYGSQILGGKTGGDVYVASGEIDKSYSKTFSLLLNPSLPAVVGVDLLTGGSAVKIYIDDIAAPANVNGSATFSEIPLTPWIGGTNNEGNSSGLKHFRGEVAEIVAYNTSLSDLEKQKIISYLSIKYGIMIFPTTINYIASDETVVFDNSNSNSYRNDAFGIGKDDASGLNLTQSNSAKTGSGDGTGQSGKGNIVLSNAGSLADGDFLLIGHNSGNFTQINSDLPASDISNGYTRVTREWKAQHTNDVGTVTLKFDILGLSLTGNSASDYRLIIDTDGDGDFSNASSTVNATSLTGTVVQFDNVTLPNGSVFTFITNLTQPLPVELTTFTSTLVENKVQLNWATATEVNNYGFEVERSTVGTTHELSQIEWAKVGFIEGHGNSNSPKEYSYIDETVQNGNYSYRLKQIDFDGKFEYSEIITVETLRATSLPTEYALEQNYPNPFNPSTTIRYSIPTVETGHAPSLQTNVVLKVYDILGNEVATLVNELKEAGNYEVKFNASNLSTGLYIYRLNAGSFVSVRKMLMLK